MKKRFISMVATAGLIATTMAFAATNSNGYVGTVEQGSPISKALPKAAYYAATDITVINATAVSLINTAPLANQAFGPSQHLHIRNYNNSSYTFVSVMDQYHNNIFNSTVCPHAIVTIQGQPGAYTWSVDEEYCH